MEFKKSKIKRFMKAVNSELGPVAQIIQSDRFFGVRFIESPHIECDSIPRFKASYWIMIENMVEVHIPEADLHFNNTGSTFWLSRKV